MSTDTSTDATDSAMLALLGGDAKDDDTGRQDAQTAEPEGDEQDDADDGADALGDAGKQALDRMKAKLRAERERRIAAEERASKAVGEDDAARIAREAEAKATAKANARILKAEVRAAAVGKLADPADALAFLDLTDFEVGDDGDVDADEIASAIDELVRRKPHLAAQGGSRSPKPDRSQGATGAGRVTTEQQFAAAIQNALK